MRRRGEERREVGEFYGFSKIQSMIIKKIKTSKIVASINLDSSFLYVERKKK